MIAKRPFGTTAIRRPTMTKQPLQRDGFIWKMRRTLDEQCTCSSREDQERISLKSVCPSIFISSNVGF